MGQVDDDFPEEIVARFGMVARGEALGGQEAERLEAERHAGTANAATAV